MDTNSFTQHETHLLNMKHKYVLIIYQGSFGQRCEYFGSSSHFGYTFFLKVISFEWFEVCFVINCKPCKNMPIVSGTYISYVKSLYLCLSTDSQTCELLWVMQIYKIWTISWRLILHTHTQRDYLVELNSYLFIAF